MKSEKAIEAIIEKYGKQIDERVKKDTGYVEPKNARFWRMENHVHDSNSSVLEKAEGKTRVLKLINLLIEADPTPKSMYFNWLLRMFFNNQFALYEDFTKAKDQLAFYEALKPKLEVKMRDIGSFDSFIVFDEFVDSKRDTDVRSNAQKDRELEKNLIEKGEAEIVMDTNEVKIVIPRTKEASVHFGRNTKWCTASNSYNYFETYNKQGPLYIVLEKKLNRRYQLHFESNQFMDELDSSLKDDVFTKVLKNFDRQFLLNKSAKNLGRILAALGTLTNKEQLELIEKNWSYISHIEKQTQAAQLAVINILKKQPLKVVEKRGDYFLTYDNGRDITQRIDYLKGPFTQKVRTAVLNLFDVNDLTPEKKLLPIVRENPIIMRFLNKETVTEAMKLTILLNSYWSHKYINGDFEDETVLRVVKRHGIRRISGDLRERFKITKRSEEFRAKLIQADKAAVLFYSSGTVEEYRECVRHDSWTLPQLMKSGKIKTDDPVVDIAIRSNSDIVRELPNIPAASQVFILSESNNMNDLDYLIKKNLSYDAALYVTRRYKTGFERIKKWLTGWDDKMRLKLYKIAVAENAKAIAYIDEKYQTEEIQKLAVKADVGTFVYIRKPTDYVKKWVLDNINAAAFATALKRLRGIQYAVMGGNSYNSYNRRKEYDESYIPDRKFFNEVAAKIKADNPRKADVPFDAPEKTERSKIEKLVATEIFGDGVTVKQSLDGSFVWLERA